MIPTPNLGANWIKEGTKLKCRVALDLDDVPVTGQSYTIQPGREGEIIEIDGAYVKVGWFNWFDNAKGEHSGFVKQLRGDFTYFWEPKGEPLPPRPRPKRPMIVDRNPSMPGMESDKRHIGFWASSADPDADYYVQLGVALPWPGDFVDHAWDPVERDKVVAYLKTGEALHHFCGLSPCRLGCEGMAGLLGSTDRSDGSYVWPEGFAHYLTEHGVRPPQEFIDYVLSK